MKKIITLLFCIIIVKVSFSQERIDIIKPKFFESSQLLSQAIGWKFNKISGKWESHLNYITDNQDEEQNFYNLHFRKIKHNDKNFYVLIVKKKSYYFDYPSIFRGYHSYTQYVSYAFTEQEYNKLKVIDEYGEVELKSICDITYNQMWEDEKDPYRFIRDWIIKKLDENPSYGYYNDNYTFKLKKVNLKDKKVYRFLLPYTGGTDDYEINFSHDFGINYFEVNSITPFLTFSKI